MPCPFIVPVVAGGKRGPTSGTPQVRSVTYEHLRTERLTPEILLQCAAAAGYEGLMMKLRTAGYQLGDC